MSPERSPGSPRDATGRIGALDIAGGTLVALLAAGWVWSVVLVRTAEAHEVVGSPVSGITASLTHADAPSTAYLTDAAARAFVSQRGVSGRLRVAIAGDSIAVRDPLPSGARIVYSEDGVVDTAVVPERPGVWTVAIAIGNAIRPVTDFSLITLRPGSEKRGGRLGLYYLGNWPAGGPARAPRGKYLPPRGFIQVTRENQDTHVSDHFRLRDFLTHDQPNVWPKYLVLRLELVDKLELVLSDLARRGVDVSGVRVMSGFRTPGYNARGGSTRGRASLSRHMYGDAADIYIDSDGDGVMDDLDHDRRITIGDARVIRDAVDRVERAHPESIGGAGIYTAAPGHGPFIHIDTRGYRARWTGTSGG